MSRIFALLRRDYRHVRGNVIALLVCIGLAIMPSLYAWFNIAGSWDPYGNTGQLKVALANTDKGIEGSIIPYQINVGDRVVSELAGSTKIGYVVTSEEEAAEGVRSGEYYAAIVIPEDFSSKLLSVLTKHPSHPQLDYYVNQKRNAIASIVTGKASGSVQTMVDEGFSEAVSAVATDLMDEISSLVDDDSLIAIASNFNEVIDDSLRALRRASDDIEAYKGVVSSIRSVADASASALGTGSMSFDAAQSLSDAADGVRGFESAAESAEAGVSSAIEEGSAALEDVEAAVDDALDAAGGNVDSLIAGLQKAVDAASARRDDLQDLYDALETLNGDVLSLEVDLEQEALGSEVNIQYAQNVSNDISDLLSRLNNAIGYLDDLIDATERTIEDVQSSKLDVEASRTTLKDLVAQARGEVESVRSDYEGKLVGSLDGLAGALDTAAADVSEVSTTLKNEKDALSPVLSDTSSGLKGLETTLEDAAEKVGKAADKLEDLRDKLSGAVASGDLDTVRTIFGADPAALVDFIASPVELDREAVYAVENNGSAMAPYYTTMALWVGGTLMGILFYAGVSKKALEETGAKPRHAYLARLLFFLTVGAGQSTMLLLGDLFFLRIQCEEPLLFMLTGWLASTVFINIIFALSSSFGDVGKALGVLLMVVQVAGSGGTFPVQMLPPVFQTLYKFLPFVYSETAMREAICGVYGDHWLVAMGRLALYLVPALLLGLVVSKPFARANEWIEERLEETKFM